jgi:hypothetical protein
LVNLNYRNVRRQIEINEKLTRIRKQCHMAHQLVDSVGLGRVEWVGIVPDVLGAVEDPEGQTGQEVAGTQIAGNRTHTKTSFGWKIIKLKNKR